MVTLKITFSLFCLAEWFLDFPDFVRDRPSRGSCFVGSCFGGIRIKRVSASVAQPFGFIQPRALSLRQPLQLQLGSLR